MAARDLPSQRNALLVEGQDDKHVVWQLYDVCQQRVQMPEFGVLDKLNLDQLLKSVPAEIRAPEREAIGIVVDADENPEKRWNEVVRNLRSAVKDFPCRLSPEDVAQLCICEPAGVVLPSKPRIGVWMMPDNESAGELEDFIARMIPAEDVVWPLANLYIDGIPRKGRKFRKEKEHKAKLFAWLAARREPGRMGAAIGAGDLSIDGELTENFVSWLRELFEPEGLE